MSRPGRCGLGADAATANPLLGGDALEPLVEAAAERGRGRVRPGADVERRRRRPLRPSDPGRAAARADGGLVAERADRLAGNRGLSGVGAVVGATEPEHLGRLRELMPAAIFLIPGVGAQGGGPATLGPLSGRIRARYWWRRRARSPARRIPGPRRGAASGAVEPDQRLRAACHRRPSPRANEGAADGKQRADPGGRTAAIADRAVLAVWRWRDDQRGRQLVIAGSRGWAREAIDGKRSRPANGRREQPAASRSARSHRETTSSSRATRSTGSRSRGSGTQVESSNSSTRSIEPQKLRDLVPEGCKELARGCARASAPAERAIAARCVLALVALARERRGSGRHRGLRRRPGFWSTLRRRRARRPRTPGRLAGDGQHHEADDRVLARDELPWTSAGRRPPTTRSRRESLLGLEAASGSPSATCSTGCCSPSGNDAAVDPRRRRRGLGAGVRAGDEPRRRPARASTTPGTRTRSASTSRATTRAPATWPRWRRGCAAERLFRRIVDTPRTTLADRRSIRARSSTTTTWCCKVPWINGVKTGYTLRCRLRAGRLGRPARASTCSPWCWARPARPRATRTRWRCCATASRSTVRETPVRRGETLAAPAVRDRDGRCRWSRPDRSRVTARRGQPSGGGRRSGEVAGADPRVGAGSGPASSPWTASVVGRVPLLAAPGARHRASRRWPRAWTTPSRGPEPSPGLARRRRGRRDRDRRLHLSLTRRRRGRGQPGQGAPTVILTVTLNAAIDRTVAVPNFRLGHRHRAVESRTVAGGKGVNVARALKLLGRPVIATGLAGGPTGIADPRAARRGVDPQRLHPDRGESRTNLAVVDPTSGEQTEINERGPEVGPRRSTLHREAALPGPGREPLRARRQRPARRRPRRLRAPDRRAAPARRARRVLDTDGEPMRARPARRARRGGARTSARPRRPSATSSTTPTTSRSGSAGLLEMGAGEAIITREAGCVAIVGDGRRPPPLRGRDRAARAGRRRRLRRLLPGRLRGGPLRGRLGPRVPRLRRRLRRRVDPALRRRQPRPATRSSGCCPGRGPGAGRPAPGSAERTRARRRGSVAGGSIAGRRVPWQACGRTLARSWSSDNRQRWPPAWIQRPTALGRRRS